MDLHYNWLEIYWCTSKFFEKLKCKAKGENNERRSWGTLLNLYHFGGKRGVLEL